MNCTVQTEIMADSLCEMFVLFQRPPLREFFVKWHEMSYWHCDWISELAVSGSFVVPYHITELVL